MKYAMVDGVKVEATKGQKGECPACGAPMISKCGEKKIWHWSHKSKIECDSWWESETLWHRDWKNHFPIGWQEVPDNSESGERHIADVKTSNNWVLEFQHSIISPQERESRNLFYTKLIWVVDGMKRKRDLPKFLAAQKDGVRGPYTPNFFKVLFPDGCALINDWLGCKGLVFFDFGSEISEANSLWCLLPQVTNRGPYILEFSREVFLSFLLSTDEDLILKIFQGILKNIVDFEVSQSRAQTQFISLPMSPIQRRNMYRRPYKKKYYGKPAWGKRSRRF